VEVPVADSNLALDEHHDGVSADGDTDLPDR